MNAIITYKEISDFIEREFHVRPMFTTVDKKTFEVSYKPGFFMPVIVVKFHIDAMRQDVLCLSYECGAAAALMIAGAVSYLEGKIPSGVEVDTDNKRIDIYPHGLQQLEKAMEYVTLSDVSFDEGAVNVSLSMV